MNKYTWGCDGVARGNFAGINIWCICGIPEGVILEVKDSKKTNKKEREKIVKEIRDKCIWSLGSTVPNRIDKEGIYTAESISLNRAYKLLKKDYEIKEMYSDLGAPGCSTIKLIKIKSADDIIPAVSAASIFAKYALDLYWERVHEYYPEYNFISNAGYGIKAKENIIKYGLIENIHRYSYKLR